MIEAFHAVHLVILANQLLLLLLLILLLLPLLLCKSSNQSTNSNMLLLKAKVLRLLWNYFWPCELGHVDVLSCVRIVVSHRSTLSLSRVNELLSKYTKDNWKVTENPPSEGLRRQIPVFNVHFNQTDFFLHMIMP